jgi:hypothetical protein
MEARRRAGRAQGAEVTRRSSTCHLGRKPIKGGMPARDRRPEIIIILWGLGKEREEVVAWGEVEED